MEEGSPSPASSDRSKSSPPSTAAELARHAGYGLTMALSAALFAWLGWRLDLRLGTRPLFLVIGCFLGFGAGFWSMYRSLVLEGRDRDARESEAPATEPDEE